MLHSIRLLAWLAAFAALLAVQGNAAAPARKPSIAVVDTLTCVVNYEIAADMTSKSNPSETEYFEGAESVATTALAKEKKVKPTDPKLRKDIQDYLQRVTRMLEAKQISHDDFESQLDACDKRFNP